MTTSLLFRASFILPLLAAAATAEQPLTVAIYPVEPLVIISANRPPRGFCIELLEAIAAQKGWRLRYQPGTLAEGYRRLERGEVDLLLPVAWTADNAVRFRLTRQGVLTTWSQLYTPPDGAVQCLADLEGRRVAVYRDDPGLPAFQQLLRTQHVAWTPVEQESPDDVLRAVARREVDAGLVERLYGGRHAAGHAVVPVPVISPAVELRLAARRENPALTETLDYWLEGMHADRHSVYHRAVRRWTEYGARRTGLWLRAIVLVAALTVVAAAVTLLGGYYRQRRQTNTLASSYAELRKEFGALERTAEGLDRWTRWYRMLFDNTQEAVLAYGVTANGLPGPFAEVNAVACEWLGYSREELLRLTPLDIETPPPLDILPPDAREDPVNLPAELLVARQKEATARAFLHLLFRNRHVTVERVYQTRDGRELPVEVTADLLTHLDAPLVICTARDLSQRRTAELALQESERRFREFFSRSPIGIAIYDAQLRLADANPACLRMFGCDDVRQFAALDLFHAPGLPPETEATLLKGGTVQGEVVLDFDQQPAGGPSAARRTGRGWFDISLTNLGLDVNYRPRGYMLQVRDITEQRRAEEALRQSEQQRRQAQKMEAIGTLAGGIAHDFNNILTPILGYTELVLRATPAGTAQRRHLEEVLKACQRARDLVKQILTFSRQTEQERKPVALTPIVKEVLVLLRASLGPRIEIRTQFETPHDIVLADPTQIHQVLMNLCTNAAHAMRERGGRLDIALRPVPREALRRGALARLPPGAYVELAVRDTGTGIPPSILDRIFDPFFTTKAPGEGTGMGLAVTHGIVASLGGLITVESELGKGSLFRVVLPLAELPEAVPPEAITAVSGGSERILFVDDEPEIAEMAAQMLTALGYPTETCLRGNEALRKFQEQPHRYDLVITDQIMPGLTGLELAAELQRVRAGVPVILCTGFSGTVSREQAQAAGIREVVMKPLLIRQLGEAIRRALAQATPPP